MNEIEEITIETMRRLSPDKRGDAIQKRFEWLKRVREQDMQNELNRYDLIYYHIKKNHIKKRKRIIGRSVILSHQQLTIFKNARLNIDYSLSLKTKSLTEHINYYERKSRTSAKIPKTI